MTESKTGSKRFNEGKPEVSQLDPNFIMDLADLMTKSAAKYGKYNWALGQDYMTPFDSLQRHMLKWAAGEDLDDESGKSHLLHAAANLMIIYTSQKLGDKDLDNRCKMFNNDNVLHTTEITENDLEAMASEYYNRTNKL